MRQAVAKPGEPARKDGADAPAAEPVLAADEPFIDEGLPIPESYDTDIIRAMIQDPFRIFIYWEVRPESLGALTRYFAPEDASEFAVTLKLTETEGRNEAFFEVSQMGRYWMMVFPDREYEFEIGMRSPRHGFISLIRSNRVRSPRGTVSPETAEQSEYRLSPPDFVDIIEASGFAAQQSLNITVAALPGASAEQAEMNSTLSRLPDAVREALLLAGAGHPLTREMIELLPEPLRSELLKLFEAADGAIASVGLIHYLPELLREVIEDDREWISDQTHPLHLAPRFFVGASENLSWPGEELRWPGIPRPGLPRLLSSQDLIK
jgi:hypothetical protein